MAPGRSTRPALFVPPSNNTPLALVLVAYALGWLAAIVSLLQN